MAMEIFKRREKKFILQDANLEGILSGLLHHMDIDEYNAGRSIYPIYNIYYDTPDNHLIRTSLNKPIYKEKLRVRSYEIPREDSLVFLEIKKKVKGVSNKRRTALTLAEVNRFIQTGNLPPYKSYMNLQVLQEISYLIQLYHLQPKVYLSYERKAFVANDGSGLRVTIDQNLMARRHNLDLTAGAYGENLLSEDCCLMEVKYANAIPLWLSNLLVDFNLYPTSFSKYGREYKLALENNTIQKGGDKPWIPSPDYSQVPPLIPQLL